MRNKFFVLVFAGLVMSLCGCFFGKKSCLTDQEVTNYISVYKNLKEKAPGLMEEVNKSKDADVSGKEGYADFEKTVKDGGIKDYKSFVLLNAKIGSVFAIMQGEKSMTNFEGLHNWGVTQIDSSIRIYDSLLSEPGIPEESKAEFRSAREEMVKNKELMETDWKENKKWADLVMEKANKITGIIVSECDIEMVGKYEKEIMEAYTGLPIPMENLVPK